MTLEQLANIGEFISGVAVAVTLIYLAIQFRQNAKSVRGATHLGNTQIWVDLLTTIAAPENVRAYMYGTSGYGDIRPKEFTQFLLQSRILFVSFENQFYQYRHGTMDAETYEGYERTTCEQILAFRGFRMYWKICRHHFSPEFIARVDAIIANTPEMDTSYIHNQWRELADSYEPKVLSNGSEQQLVHAQSH